MISNFWVELGSKFSEVETFKLNILLPDPFGMEKTTNPKR